MLPSIDELWNRAVEFHGHACPGLAIGCGMAVAAANHLGISGRAEDEELVCVTESDACCVDAVQALLGCTLGKGNLYLKLRGKAAMSFYERGSGRGCRVVWQGAGKDDLSREEKIAFVLSEEGLSRFAVTTLNDAPPPEARLSRSLPCASCGERAAEFMLRVDKGDLYCLECRPDLHRIL